jgi:hypothetical protein
MPLPRGALSRLALKESGRPDFPLIPAQPGIRIESADVEGKLGPRFRGDERVKGTHSLIPA